MSYSRKFVMASFLVFSISALPLLIFSQVFHHPNPDAGLIMRWDWARQKAGEQRLKAGFWIGYSIKRLMREHQYICSTSEHITSGTHSTHFLRG